MTNKVRVAILAGGRSSEHDISRLSAKSVIDALDPERYDAVPVLIERNGDWRITTPSKLVLGSPTPEPHTSQDFEPAEASQIARRTETRPATVTSPSSALRGIDVIFPVLHGPYGEDGKMQGLLETAGVPYVGAGVLASAIGMDKAIFKAVLRDAGIPVAPGLVAYAGRCNYSEISDAIEENLSWPVFVKPARLGSSIGISKVLTREQLNAALDLAFAHDSKVVVEAMVDGIEVECGVLDGTPPIASVPGQVVIADDAEWYDFETKYHQGRCDLLVPAPIDAATSARVSELALKVFEAIDCSGLARVDCFVTADGDVVVNEINTMPGFTATSAYGKLFEASGVSYNEVVDRLIALAMDRHRNEMALRH